MSKRALPGDLRWCRESQLHPARDPDIVIIVHPAARSLCVQANSDRCGMVELRRVSGWGGCVRGEVRP